MSDLFRHQSNSIDSICDAYWSTWQTCQSTLSSSTTEMSIYRPEDDIYDAKPNWFDKKRVDKPRERERERENSIRKDTTSATLASMSNNYHKATLISRMNKHKWNAMMADVAATRLAFCVCVRVCVQVALSCQHKNGGHFSLDSYSPPSTTAIVMTAVQVAQERSRSIPSDDIRPFSLLLLLLFTFF